MRQTLHQVSHECQTLDFIDASINPTSPRLFTVITTFAGIGGSSLGYKWAGGKVLAAVEWDENAVATYRLNHHGTPVLHRDIATVTAEELLELTGLQSGELDIFDGSPPCFPSGTLIATERGKIPIEFCTVGMRAVTHTGKLERITHTMAHQHVGQLYTIETKYGRKSFTCTPDHPIWARRRISLTRDNATRKNGTRYKAYGESEWISARDLQVEDVLCEPHITGTPSLEILPVITKQRINLEGESGSVRFDMQLIEHACTIDWQTPEMAWLLGFYLAEGHVRGRNPTLENDGPCRREAIYSIADGEAADLAIKFADVGLHPIVQKHSQGSSRVTISSIDFWVLCQVMGKYAHKKFIPAAFHCMSIEWQEAFMNGYFEGDGCVTESKRVKSQKRKATTVSWDVATGIAKMIARVYGVVASIEVLYPAGVSKIQGRDVEVKETYSVGYPLLTSDRIRPGFVDEQGAWLPIKAIHISETEGTEVFNMEVEDDHSYTAEGYAVHNCQGFSMASTGAIGSRHIDDPRNSLFREYVRLLRGLQPKVFVMENVSGMIKGQMKHVFAIAMRELKSSGYQVKCQLLDAAYFGVPQHRQRVIFIGTRNDLGVVPSHPKAQTGVIGSVRLDSVPSRYSERRYGDTLELAGHPIGTITKIGRKFWSTTEEFGPLSYSVNASFPRDFQFCGSFNNRKARIGNTVPPKFMQAIAEHIYQHMLVPLQTG